MALELMGVAAFTTVLTPLAPSAGAALADDLGLPADAAQAGVPQWVPPGRAVTLSADLWERP
jgi:hypothetical protein